MRTERAGGRAKHKALRIRVFIVGWFGVVVSDFAERQCRSAVERFVRILRKWFLIYGLKLRQRHLHDPEAAGRGGGVAGFLDEDALPLVVDYGIGQSAGSLGEVRDYPRCRSWSWKATAPCGRIPEGAGTGHAGCRAGSCPIRALGRPSAASSKRKAAESVGFCRGEECACWGAMDNTMHHKPPKLWRGQRRGDENRKFPVSAGFRANRMIRAD